MALWSGMFTKDARPADSQAATARAVSTIGRSALSNQLTPQDNVRAAVEGHYKRVLWVFRAVDAIALAQCTLQMRVWTDRTDEAKLVPGWEHLERLLNVKPNKYEKAWQLRYRISTLLLLSSMGVFVEIVRDKVTNDPAELHIIAPDAVQPMQDPKKWVTGYRVRTVDGFRDLPPENVLWIRGRPDPLDVYKQITPLMSAGLAADTDWLAHMFNANWLRNDGRPGLLISVGNDVGPEDADELKRRFGGNSRAGETSVIQSEQVDVKDLGGSPRDAQYVETLKGSKQEILMAFGVAETFLAWAEGRTYDNADAEIEVVWETTMRQHCLMVGSGFDTLVEDENDSASTIPPAVAHDLTKVSVLQRAKKNKDEAALAEFSAGLITPDEYREQIGRKPFNVAQSKSIWMPAGLMSIAPDDSTEKKINKLAQDAQPTPPIDPNNAIAPPGAAPKGVGSAPAGKGRTTPASSAQVTALAKQLRAQSNQTAADNVRSGGRPRSIQSAKARLARSETKDDEHEPAVLDAEVIGEVYDPTEDEILDLIDSHAAQLTETLSAWGADMLEVGQARLTGVKARQDTRHWTPSEEQKDQWSPSRDLDTFYVIQSERWLDSVSATIRVMVRNAASESMAQVRPQLGLDAEAVMRASRLVQGMVNRLMDDVDRGLKRKIRGAQALIRQMDKAGRSLEEIKDALANYQLSIDAWAGRVGPSVARAATQGARAIMADRVPDLHVEKVWRTQRDSRVRDPHEHAEGQVAKRGVGFVIDGSKMAFPGDPRAPAALWVNCRCFIGLRRPDGTEF